MWSLSALQEWGRVRADCLGWVGWRPAGTRSAAQKQGLEEEALIPEGNGCSVLTSESTLKQGINDASYYGNGFSTSARLEIAGKKWKELKRKSAPFPSVKRTPSCHGPVLPFLWQYGARFYGVTTPRSPTHPLPLLPAVPSTSSSNSRSLSREFLFPAAADCR